MSRLQPHVVDCVVVEGVLAPPVPLSGPWIRMADGPLDQMQRCSAFEGELTAHRPQVVRTDSFCNTRYASSVAGKSAGPVRRWTCRSGSVVTRGFEVVRAEGQLVVSSVADRVLGAVVFGAIEL